MSEGGKTRSQTALERSKEAAKKKNEEKRKAELADANKIYKAFKKRYYEYCRQQDEQTDSKTPQ